MNKFNPQPKPKRKKTSKISRWNYIRTKKLKPMFQKIGITSCEITNYLYSHGMISSEQAIERNFALGFAHRHKRVWYKAKEELLGDYNQVILLGQYYHQMIENDRELTKRWFLALRGKE